MSDRKSLIRALSCGADDYMTKPIFLDEVRLRLDAAERLLRLEGQDALIFSMAKMMEFRSEETGFHLERVRRFTRIAARDFALFYPEYRLSLSIADEIALVSPLHDIGKIGVPDHILHKPGELTPEEWKLMQRHTTIGGALLRELYEKNQTPYLRFAYQIAQCHHEHWDGSGYPDGLAGEEIPLAARIMALADVYDALTTRRSYKGAFSHEKAREIVLENSGTQFDPRIVDGFLRQEFEWQAVKERFQEAPPAPPAGRPTLLPAL
jgi:putative two-component system response regulator